LEHAAGQHDREVGRQNRHHAADDEQQQPRINRRLAADAVGQRPEEHLAQRQADKQRGDHELGVVGPGRAQLAANLLQGRQHDVDRQRNQGNDQRRERNEFAEAELRAGARQGTNTKGS